MAAGMSSPLPGKPLRATAADPPPRPGHASLVKLVLVIAAILGAASLLAGLTWSRFTATSAWWSVPPFLLASASFITTTLLGVRRSPPWLRALYTLSAVMIGVLNFFLFAAGACLLVGAVAFLFGWPPDLRLIAWGMYGVAALVSTFALLNARRVRLRRLTIRLPGLPAAWEGKTAALVTDAHCGNLLGPRFSQRLVTRLRRAAPDVVLIGGDFFDGALARPERFTDPWQELRPPWGVYFVTGNHEEFDDPAAYLDALRSAGITILPNEKILLHGLQLLGVSDHATRSPQRLRDVLARMEIDPRVASVLLMHQPKHVEVVEAAGVTLQLSGHTHGGQCWPITHLAARAHGRFTGGLQCLRRLQVLTSHGAGTWGPPMRLGTRSEIYLITFVT